VNLHSLASGMISAVNPQIPVLLRASIGNSMDAAGKRSPAFATPGAFSGSISGQTLTVSSITLGKLLAGQAIAGAGVITGTKILQQLTGTPGGPGTYQVDQAQTVTAESMTSSLTVLAQIQHLTWRDLQLMEGLVLQGTRRAIYLFGAVEAVVRSTNQGGDLITFPDGSLWLVAQVLETYGNDGGAKVGWVKVAATLQNGS
jgi:hypothetical protein